MAEDISLHKRAQISRANRTMFLWIAAASVLVGASLVLSFFLFKILLYEERVLSAKTETDRILTSNLKSVDGLKDEIRVLDTNESLASIKANERDQTLQVILDALPSEPNSLALGASLQNRLLLGGDAGDVTVDSIRVEPVQDSEDESADVVSGASVASTNVIPFQFSVKGSDAGLRNVLSNLERSIRTIQVQTVRISGEAGGQTMTVQGVAFFEPAKKIELREVVVPREDKKR